MGRPRKWASDAERMAAVRSGFTNVVAGHSGSPPMVTGSGLPACSENGILGVSNEEIDGLAKARELGRRYGVDEVARLARSSHPDPDPKARIQRAIRYAEWNWTENGKIA